MWRAGSKPGIGTSVGKPSSATAGARPTSSAQAMTACACTASTTVRKGGVKALAERMRAGELTPDFGPTVPHPTAGATLVGARPPLVAFNLELMPPATVADARRIAGLIREGGAEGLPGVRAIGVALGRGPQVSFNIERPTEVPLRTVVEAVERHAVVACAELVGLAPATALEGFPADLPMPGFNPARHVIEKALGL